MLVQVPAAPPPSKTLTYSKIERGHVLFDKTEVPEGTLFDENVNPGEDGEWNEAACRESHGLTKAIPVILNTGSIQEVWPLFGCFFPWVG